MKKFLTLISLLFAISMVLSGCNGTGRYADDSRQQSTVMGPDAYGSDSYGAYCDTLTPRTPGECADICSYAVPANHINAIHFDFDSSAIKDTERCKLEPVIEYLKCNCNNRVLIEGRCDWYGTAEYNLALGERRANSAKTYLIQMGATENQIATVSKGSLEAIQGLSKAESIKDRRDDIYRISR